MFNVATTVTDQATSVLVRVVIGAVLAPLKKEQRWGWNFEGKCGGRYEKCAVQRDTYLLTKHLFRDREETAENLDAVGRPQNIPPRSELIIKIDVPINTFNLSEGSAIAVLNITIRRTARWRDSALCCLNFMSWVRRHQRPLRSQYACFIMHLRIYLFIHCVLMRWAYFTFVCNVMHRPTYLSEWRKLFSVESHNYSYFRIKSLYLSVRIQHTVLVSIRAGD